ncbi:uncharacterized protein LOC128558895 [Mercenaria mercenaria]|uniref:uncharacterized protein LOC128558895 n=1 Tax=Mercenaria mercenaria TaxID=6596 RepID=UPI00234EE75B|nr:uncharacterized protein LOC128558895 [Mercenaria mercenaria]
MATKFPRRMLPSKCYPTPTNVTYEKGGLAILYCSVKNLRTKTLCFVQGDKFTTKMIVSRLTIAKSYMSDTGTFVCRTPELLSATFKVDVLNHPSRFNY